MTQALLPRRVCVRDSDEQPLPDYELQGSQVWRASWLAEREPVGVAGDSPVEETAVSEQSVEFRVLELGWSKKPGEQREKEGP